MLGLAGRRCRGRPSVAGVKVSFLCFAASAFSGSSSSAGSMAKALPFDEGKTKSW